MTLTADARRRLRPTEPRWSALDAPLTSLPDDQVLSFLAWCQLNNFSERTGRRIIANGDGPVVTWLGPRRRIGITVRDNAKWQRSRAIRPGDQSNLNTGNK
jgi:hypothetical protein